MVSRAEYVYGWLRQHGYNHNAASGLVGNLMTESKLNPDAVGDVGYKGGSSFGIAQWRGDRLRNLRAYANATRGNPNDLNTQLGFLNHELQTSYRNVYTQIQNAPTVQHATASVVLGYERPKGSETGNAANTAGWQNRLYHALNVTGGGGTGQQQPIFAATTTPQSSGGTPTPTTTPRETQTAATTQNINPGFTTQTQTASATTPGSAEYGADNDALQTALSDIEPPPQDQAQQEEYARMPSYQGGGYGGETANADGPHIQIPEFESTNPSDPNFYKNAQKSAQDMAQIGQSDLGNLFADAYQDNAMIGAAGRSQEEIAKMLAAKNQNRTIG